MTQDDEIRILHEAYQFLLKKYKLGDDYVKVEKKLIKEQEEHIRKLSEVGSDSEADTKMSSVASVTQLLASVSGSVASVTTEPESSTSNNDDNTEEGDDDAFAPNGKSDTEDSVIEMVSDLSTKDDAQSEDEGFARKTKIQNSLKKGKNRRATSMRH